MKTSMELKKAFDQKVEEVSTKMAVSLYHHLAEVIDNSLKEFWQVGRITVSEGLEKIYRNVLNSENLSVDDDSKICRAIVRKANEKLEEYLAKEGWKLTMRVLEPLEPIESASDEEE